MLKTPMELLHRWMHRNRYRVIFPEGHTTVLLPVDKAQAMARAYNGTTVIDPLPGNVVTRFVARLLPLTKHGTFPGEYVDRLGQRCYAPHARSVFRRRYHPDSVPWRILESATGHASAPEQPWD